MDRTPSAAATSLDADLRALQNIVNRRGWAWLVKWTAMFVGVEPKGLTDAIGTAPVEDPGLADYGRNFPACPDPRD